VPTLHAAGSDRASAAAPPSPRRQPAAPHPLPPAACAAAQLVRCYQGNHLLSGRTCQEQLAKYEECLSLHNGVGERGSFLDAVAAAAKQLGAELEARRDAVLDAWQDWKNQRR
jgi:hypothetical protein